MTGLAWWPGMGQVMVHSRNIGDDAKWCAAFWLACVEYGKMVQDFLTSVE